MGLIVPIAKAENNLKKSKNEIQQHGRNLLNLMIEDYQL